MPIYPRRKAQKHHCVISPVKEMPGRLWQCKKCGELYSMLPYPENPPPVAPPKSDEVDSSP